MTPEEAIERLKQTADDRAETLDALLVLARLVAAEQRRHPGIPPALQERERQDVARRLAVFRRSNAKGSPIAWLCKRTGLPVGRVRRYLKDLRAIRADCADIGHAPPKSPEIAP
jgi:hypothetical protein